MRQHVIDQLRREGLAGVWTAEVCERAGYKCEYCDKDILASVDNYLSWELDHIIPDRLEAITRLRIWPLAVENVLCGLKGVGIQCM